MSTNQTTDKVFLRELAVECIIGFLDWERLVKQTVYLDIEAPIDCRRAAARDDVAATLDYKRLSKFVCAYVARSSGPLPFFSSRSQERFLYPFSEGIRSVPVKLPSFYFARFAIVAMISFLSVQEEA